MTRCTWLKPCLWAAIVALLVCNLPAVAQSAAPAPAAQAAPASAAVDAPLAVSGPSADDLAAGDPSGTKTGTVNDITRSDPSKGLTLTDVVNQIGQNRIGINFTWTLVCGFLVMFMQAGFAIVETGLCRAKSANHTMMMNFMVYGFGLFAYWVCGFAIQMGSAAGTSMLGGAAPLNSEYAIHLLGHDWGLFGMKGFFLSGATYDVGVMVLFLFQMVFMDTALTIVTGAVAERWKYIAFCVSSLVLGGITYPLFAHWAWGGGWLAKLGTNFGLGAGYADFAGSGVVHSVGADDSVGRSSHHRPAHRQIQSRWLVERNTGSRHGDCTDRLLHPGLRLVRIQSGQHAGRVGRFAHQHGGRRHHARGMYWFVRRSPVYVD